MFIKCGFFSRPYCCIKEGESTLFWICKYLFKALHLFSFPTFPGPMFIFCPTSIPESRVHNIFYDSIKALSARENLSNNICYNWTQVMIIHYYDNPLICWRLEEVLKSTVVLLTPNCFTLSNLILNSYFNIHPGVAGSLKEAKIYDMFECISLMLCY